MFERIKMSFRKPGRTDARRASQQHIESHAEYQRLLSRDDSRQARNVTTTTTSSIHQEVPPRQFSLQELSECLNVPLFDTTDSGCPAQPKTNIDQLAQMVQRSVEENFPKPPANLKQDLQQHLLDIQEMVTKQLLRVDPLLSLLGLMGHLIGCYHKKIFRHLDTLLQDSRSTQTALVLLNWVLQIDFSQELFGHPELQRIDLIGNIDLLISIEWVYRTKDELLGRVKRDTETGLEKSLECDRSNNNSHDDEACVGLYVDVIQLIDSFPKETQKISSKLSADVQEVCFQELLIFLRRFNDEQVDFLQQKANMDNPEMYHFLKTLKFCSELKQYVNSRANSITRPLVEKILATLENLEASTQKCLKKCVAKLAKSHFKTYFKGDDKQICILMGRIHMIFPKTWMCEETRETVMNEVFKVLIHKYIKHLVKVSQKKLRKLWRVHVGQILNQDATLLQRVMEDLALKSEECNLLVDIKELLICKDIEMVVSTVTDMLTHHLTLREDPDLLVALLHWKGLQWWDIERVLDTCTELQFRPRTRRSLRCLPHRLFVCCIQGEVEDSQFNVCRRHIKTVCQITRE